MNHTDRLSLHEEILLLALRGEEGTIAAGTTYQHALGAAIVAELLLRDRLAVSDPEGKKLAEVIDRKSTRDALLDECLEQIAADHKPRPLAHWVGKFAGIKGLKHRVAERLCECGILREEEGKVLIVFTRRIYPETDPRPEQAIVERLRRAVMTDARDVGPRTVVLVSLTNATGILKQVFDKKELKERAGRIEQVINGELVGKAARDAVQAMQAAVMVAAIMPAVITTSTSR
jgi:hypothetical protein